jgi:hypothetical protein
MMGFTALLVAILLHVASEPLQRRTPLPLWLDLMIAGLVILGCWRSPDGFLAPI